MWILIVQFAVIILAIHGNGGDADEQLEPRCLSRFDHDYKVIQKLAMLELQQTELQKTILNYKASTNAKWLVMHKEADLMAKVKELIGKVQTLETTVSSLQAISPTEGTGSTYVRWGRTDCPGNGSDLVYKGYAGGSNFSDTGAAANYICLTDKPIYGYFESGQQSSAKVYGAEYQLDRTNNAGFFQKKLRNDDVPCAVCQTTRSSVLMIPGRNACYAGWTLEYKGYLMGGYSGHNAASEFVCLDDDSVPIPGGHRDSNGKLFYFAEGICGSLSCPPYVDGQELTCAVCSK